MRKYVLISAGIEMGMVIKVQKVISSQGRVKSEEEILQREENLLVCHIENTDGWMDGWMDGWLVGWL